MLKIGSILNLEPNKTSPKEKFKCKVHDIQESKILIDYPVNLETDRTIFLLDGMQLTASFVNDDGSAFMFETEVLGRRKNTIPLIVLHFPGNEKLIKIQRRKFVRIETSVDVSVKLNFNGAFVEFTSITNDVSAGGCALILPRNHSVKKGMEGNIWLVLPMQSGDIHYLHLQCKVARIGEENHKQIASIQFENVPNHEQQILFRFCFDRQLSMKRKGVLS
ncbi:flagellar brake protein [Falsibacillus albus]|uniref:Pilus assembly protein PilZ n=1 Tax=Falsibacillus albus TaxID=2478915 RepID=A0A3L7JY85_9BACI|nr:flagellar brake domain-containing protein [Falsibacillus albus]RLQ95079.1 pilus assembly protein PilZ [Falsibacillus albus]